MAFDRHKLAAARSVLSEIATHLEAGLSAELWNGEVIPLGPNARDDIRFVIRSPDAIRRALLKPSLETMFRLYGEGLIDITGGTPLAAARRWDHLKALALPKKVSRLAMAKAAMPFLFSGAKGGLAGAAYDKDVAPGYGAARNDQDFIRFHYDVSNDFYGLFLDPEMVYSCAYFTHENATLEEAQIAKLDLICRKLRLQKGDKLLDIGCGWGGLICHAAKNYGAIAHGVTLSQAQLDYCNAKITRLALDSQVKVELRDYRSIDAPEHYDKIAQIEMFEHIGIDNHDLHFAHMNRLLRTRGLYLHQASTRMATKNIGAFRKRTKYQQVINKLIFPGGELDYIGLSTTNLERHRFEVHDIEGMREHFQRTLEHWTDRLYRNRERAEAMAGKERARLWLLYFSLFAMAFERNTVSVFQTLASKRRTGPSGLGLKARCAAPDRA
jgi:cyclopropane-fatty-acyl-phospholipid synthase